MRPLPSLVVLASLASCSAPRAAAIASPSAPAGAPPTAAATPAAPAAASAQAAGPKERTGVLVPVELTAISLWPEAYSGELFVTKILPPGSEVAAGDVVAELSTRAIDEALRDAELEVGSAQVRHDGLLQRQAIEEAAALSALDQAHASLERSQRALEGYQKREIPFAARSDELAQQREKSWIDDQKDELAQLEAMYKADELTDATEEIVLKRSRRDLASTEFSNALSSDRRRYQDEYGEKIDAETREEAVRVQSEALDRTIQSQAIDARGRADAAERSTAALAKDVQRLERLRRDRELLTIRAPRAGVLLHGRVQDYRPGRSPARLERGSQLGSRTDVMLVADPSLMAVALDIPESDLKDLRSGATVTVRPIAAPGAATYGDLVIDPFPIAQQAAEGTFAGTVVLEETDPSLVFGMHVTVSFESRKVAE